jgi:hypothetical protein
MRTQAGAKSYADVTSFSVKLIRTSPDTVVAGPTSVAPNPAGSTVTFNNVTTGFTYVIEVDALGVGDVSISESGPARSAPVSVADAISYDAGTIQVQLRNESSGEMPMQLSPPAYLTGTITCQAWLRNQATDEIAMMPTVTVPAGVTTDKILRGVQAGTYDVWVAMRNTTHSTPARFCGTWTTNGATTTALNDASGTPVASLPAGYAATLTEVGSVPGANLQGMAMDANDIPYVAAKVSDAVYRFPSGGPEAYVGLGGNGSSSNGDPRMPALMDSPTACAINAHGDVFVAEGGGDFLRIVPQAGAASYGFPGIFSPNAIYLLKGTYGGNFEISDRVTVVAVAPTGELYYNDGKEIRCQPPSGGSYSSLGVLLQNPNSLATDRFGNLFAVANSAAANSTVYMYVARLGKYFGQDFFASGWYPITTLPVGTLLRGVTVDRVGNVYITDDSGLVRMIDTTDRTKVYMVAGGGGAPVAAGLAPTSVSMPSVFGVGVSNAGQLFFAANSGVWRL